MNSRCILIRGHRWCWLVRQAVLPGACDVDVDGLRHHVVANPLQQHPLASELDLTLAALPRFRSVKLELKRLLHNLLNCAVSDP